uniref:HTH cro/C1-type domain-containing protein n=1 Tax=uncultured organism TaxID=155900 RepID=M1P162_9ZZZZ|nr:hypothetical protein FLSS-17_0014 [uncultured organism]
MKIDKEDILSALEAKNMGDAELASKVNVPNDVVQNIINNEEGEDKVVNKICVVLGIENPVEENSDNSSESSLEVENYSIAELEEMIEGGEITKEKVKEKEEDRPEEERRTTLLNFL